MYVFDKNLSNLMLVLIDDQFDGFIYSGNDINLDRVGYQDIDGFHMLKFERDELNKTIKVTIPSGDEIVIHIEKYKNHLKLAFNELEKIKNNFIPFDQTTIAPEFKTKDQSNSKEIPNIKLKKSRNKALGMNE